jgi:nucleoside-diphosphate-sugar epimerase
MHSSTDKAIVIGASGISGYSVAKRLLSQGWDVTGVSRNAPAVYTAGMKWVLTDVSDADRVRSDLAGCDYTHAFYCTWARRDTEAENRRANQPMLQNTLDALTATPSLRHVALVTGLKHYMGPFEAYGTGEVNETPFRERQPRVEYENFYYDQEDCLFAAAEKHGFSWSVHRSHTLIGWALGNAMNMGVTLAVYGSICRHLGKPFVFPGTPVQYSGLNDLTDAGLLAEQLEWAATSPQAADEAFNIVDGDVIRWRTLWGVLADDLGVETGPYPGQERLLAEEMTDAEPIWQAMVSRYDLRPSTLDRLVSWWHTDADLGRQMETLADMNKSRALGFTQTRDTEKSFADLFDLLRAERIIPDFT